MLWLWFQGLDEEKLVYERSSSKNIYLNVAVNTLKKLRSKCSSRPSPVTSKSPQHTGNITWPVGEIRCLPAVCLQTCTTQRGFFCTDTFTTASNPPHYSWWSWSSRGQQAEAGSDGDHRIYWTRHRRQLLSPQTLLTSSSVSSTCVSPLFHPEIFVFFPFLHIVCFRSIIKPPLAPGESSWGNPAGRLSVYIHLQEIKLRMHQWDE